MISISKANSISFYPVDVNTGRYNRLQSFSTRNAHDERHANYVAQRSSTYFLQGEDTEIQVITADDETLSASSETITVSTPTQLATFDGYIIWTFGVSMTQSGRHHIEVFTDTEKHRSECINILSMGSMEASESGYLKVQWFNFDNAFMLDFRAPIVCHSWVRGIMLEYSPSSEIDVFQNNEETLKLREVVRRGLRAVFTDISRQSAEKFVLASAMDKFFINEVEYVREEDVEIEAISNAVDLSMNLIERNVTGLNTHDLGINTELMPDIQTIAYETQTGSFTSDPIPFGWILHVIRFKLVEGSDIVLAAGMSPGLNDIIYPLSPQDAPIENQSYPVHMGDAGQVSITITGTNPIVNVYFDLYRATG